MLRYKFQFEQDSIVIVRSYYGNNEVTRSFRYCNDMMRWL